MVFRRSCGGFSKYFVFTTSVLALGISLNTHVQNATAQEAGGEGNTLFVVPPEGQDLVIPAPCVENFSIGVPEGLKKPDLQTCKVGLLGCENYKKRDKESAPKVQPLFPLAKTAEGRLIIEFPTAGISGTPTPEQRQKFILDVDAAVDQKIQMLVDSGHDYGLENFASSPTASVTPVPTPTATGSSMGLDLTAVGKVVDTSQIPAGGVMLWGVDQPVCRFDKNPENSSADFVARTQNNGTGTGWEAGDCAYSTKLGSRVALGCNGDDDNFEEVCFDFSQADAEMAYLRGLYLMGYRHVLEQVKQELTDSKVKMKNRDPISGPALKVTSPACREIGANVLQSYLSYEQLMTKVVDQDAAFWLSQDTEQKGDPLCKMDAQQFNDDCAKNPGKISCESSAMNVHMAKLFFDLILCEVDSRAREYFQFHFSINHSFFLGLIKAEATACRNFAEEVAGSAFNDDAGMGRRVIQACWKGQGLGSFDRQGLSEIFSEADGDEVRQAYHFGRWTTREMPQNSPFTLIGNSAWRDNHKASFGFVEMIRDVYVKNFFDFKAGKVREIAQNYSTETERKYLLAGSSADGKYKGYGRRFHNDRLIDDHTMENLGFGAAIAVFFAPDISGTALIAATEATAAFTAARSLGLFDGFSGEQFYFSLNRSGEPPSVTKLLEGWKLPPGGFRSSKMSDWDDDDMGFYQGVLSDSGMMSADNDVPCRDSLGIMVTGRLKSVCCDGAQFNGDMWGKDGCPNSIDDVVADQLDSAAKDINATNSVIKSMSDAVGASSGASISTLALPKGTNPFNATLEGNNSETARLVTSAATANNPTGSRAQLGGGKDIAASTKILAAKMDSSSAASGGAGGTLGSGTTSAAAVAGAAGAEKSTESNSAGGSYSSGGAGGAYGGGGYGSGSNNSVGAVEGMTEFGAKAASDVNPMNSEDPEDYFTRTNLTDSLFRRAEKVYQYKNQGWALDEAQSFYKKAAPKK